MKISNFKIGTRLGVGFGIQILLMSAAIGVGFYQVNIMNDMAEDIVHANNVIMRAAYDMRTAQNEVMLASAKAVMLTDPAAHAEQEAAVRKSGEAYDSAAAVLKKLATSAPSIALVARVDAAAAETRPLVNKVRALALANATQEASDMLIRVAGPASARWQASLGDLLAYEATSNEKAALKVKQAHSDAHVELLLLGILAGACGILVAWLATRSIVRPMRLAVTVAQRVAEGDLNSQIEATSTDETGAMLAALKTMNSSLKNIVGQVRSGTETIASASTQIASGNLELSARTEQQASSLEETAASMEELTATVKQNADNARQANVLAVSASEVAIKGGAVVARVVQTMSSINDSSRKIVDIIGVIDSIAFQTNILALNAAVEAARAGEQGRGFAVVASEVRNLAQRSAGAAKEIKALIDDSVDKVALGSTLVNNAGATMDEVVASVKRVSDIMGEISAAGREQELGIAQINQAVIEMDTVTQQNAALVEEAAAAAESLQYQAGTLMDVVSVFKLDRQSVAAPVRAAATVAPLKPALKRPVLNRPAAAPKRVANGAPVAHADWEAF